MNKHLISLYAVTALVAAQPAAADTLALDTGTPGGSSTFPMTLDGNDFYAAKFSLGSGRTVTGLQAYLTSGADADGTTFTVALYSDNALGGLFDRFGSPVYSGQATYHSDGWTGLSGVNLSGLSAGSYWLALEVGGSDSATGLSLPSPVTGGTAPALAFAFNPGSGYQLTGAQSFGAQVTTVPLPAAELLFGSGIFGLLGVSRRKSFKQIDAA